MNPARLLSSKKIWNAIRYLDPDFLDTGISSGSSVEASAFGYRAQSTHSILTCALIPKSHLAYFVFYRKIGAHALLRGLLHTGILLKGVLKGPR